MKVVHLSTTDMGGAYEAAQRISDCMIMSGVESQVVVRTKFRQQTAAVPFYRCLPQKFISKVKNFFNLMVSEGEVVVDKYGTDICKASPIKEADIICLHWVNSFVSSREVKNILSMGKPVYWVMHDMWPFTGGCHYSGACENYRVDCRQCPMVGNTTKEVAYIWQSKKKMYFEGNNLVPVGPSRWISDCAKQSSIFGGKNIITIPNPIDTTLFCPKSEEDKRAIRREYGLPEDKVIVLFAAAKVTNNPIKGFAYFVDAVNRLSREQYEILILGENDGESFLKQEIKLQIHHTGFVDRAEKLCEIYNAADMLVAPSLQENYSNTVLESLSCGTPAVVFDVGGMKELVQTGVNGYLAGSKDAQDLYCGIMKVAEDRGILGKTAREIVLKQNAFSVIAKEYISAFRRSLSIKGV